MALQDVRTEFAGGFKEGELVTFVNMPGDPMLARVSYEGSLKEFGDIPRHWSDLDWEDFVPLIVISGSVVSGGWAPDALRRVGDQEAGEILARSLGLEFEFPPYFIVCPTLSAQSAMLYTPFHCKCVD